MKKNENIKKIMSTELITANVKQPISEVRKMMSDSSIHHVPVVSGKKLVGMISSGDLLRISAEGVGTDQRSLDAYLDHQFVLEDIMKTELRTISETGTVRDATNLLSEGSYHSVPVINDTDELLGIVTSTDLIRYLQEQY